MKKIILSILIFLCLSVTTAFTQAYTLETTDLKQEFNINKESRPFRIRVLDQSDNPVQGIRIRIISTASKKQGRFTIPEGKTDPQGNFSSVFEAGSKDGKIHLTFQAFRNDKLIAEENGRIVLFNIRNIIFYMIGGLGIFLFGMKLMSGGLQSVAGEKLKSILGVLTKNTFIAVTVGFLITALIQSSSATTVMVVGFLNANLLSLAQSVGVIMGANIGTTITAQIIAFPIKYYAYPVVALGVLFLYLSKRKNIHFWGEVLIGLGLLFIGMTIMSSTLKPLADSQAFQSFFIHFSQNPLLGVLAGILLTCLIQSSSATVGLTMALAMSGLIDISGAVPIVLGDNIGTTITAQLAAINGNRPARQAALVHTLFNVLGSTWIILSLFLFRIDGMPWYYKFIGWLTPGALFVQDGRLLFSGNAGRFLANSHMIFNIANTIVFLPLAGFLAKTARWIIPDRAETHYKYLDHHLLRTPALALEQSKKEIFFMATRAEKIYSMSAEGLMTGNAGERDKIYGLEDEIDTLQNEIISFLTEISNSELHETELIQIPRLIHMANDLERIGDLSINIEERRERVANSGMSFSEDHIHVMKNMDKIVHDMLSRVIAGLKTNEIAQFHSALKLEGRINEARKYNLTKQVDQMTRKKSKVPEGLIIVDYLNFCEKIGDHLTNICEAYTHLDQQT